MYPIWMTLGHGFSPLSLSVLAGMVSITPALAGDASIQSALEGNSSIEEALAGTASIRPVDTTS